MKKTIYTNSKCSTLCWVRMTGMILKQTALRHTEFDEYRRFCKKNLMQSITKIELELLVQEEKSCLYASMCINIQTSICTIYTIECEYSEFK